MCRFTGAYCGLFVIASISASSFHIADANAFLHTRTSVHEERISEQEVQASLLAEIEGTFGEGSASSRLKQFDVALGPMYAALPKNEQGYLGHATVRYALHRLFVQRHGWFIKGLHAGGGHRNSTSSAGLLKEQVPAYIQDIFEERLAGRGFGLHELAVLAATIEHLVHNEAIKRLGDVFRAHNLLPTSLLREDEVDDVLDTYMAVYILNEDISNMTYEEVLDLKAEMPDTYNHWKETQDFVRIVRQNITRKEGNSEQQSSGSYDFSIVARVAERVGEQFGILQAHDCKPMKDRLMEMEDRGMGRVRLSDLHRRGNDGTWQFQESTAYLRQLGVLDESDSAMPRVIIPNYISAPSNCIASSSFYSVCCIDECEDLLGHLEIEIAAPEATPTRLASLIAKLPSSSVSAPRELSSALLLRLEEIAASNHGSVPLHGRLFAQWMHHAFPRECPYPQISGTTNPLTPDEYEEETGELSAASEEELQGNADMAFQFNTTFDEAEVEEAPVLPWSPEEELLVCRPPPLQAAPQSSLLSTMRSALLFAAMVMIAFGLVRTSWSTTSASQTSSVEKLFV